MHQATTVLERSRAASLGATTEATQARRPKLPAATGLFVAVLASALLWSAPAGAIIWLLR